MSRKTTMLAAALAGIFVAGAAQAELSGNIAASSDYVWRGITQTNHASAVSGGIDYAHSSGLYVGGWASNIAADTEIDLYGGFGYELGNGLGLDAGYIAYVYPANTIADFNEVYFGLSYAMVSAKVSYDIDNKDIYSEVALSHSTMGLDLGFHVGSYTWDQEVIGSKEDYIDYNVSVGKNVGDWAWTATLNGVDQGLDGSDVNVFPYFSVSRSFDL